MALCRKCRFWQVIYYSLSILGGLYYWQVIYDYKQNGTLPTKKVSRSDFNRFDEILHKQWPKNFRKPFIITYKGSESVMNTVSEETGTDWLNDEGSNTFG